jgi:hypothetical protein
MLGMALLWEVSNITHNKFWRKFAYVSKAKLSNHETQNTITITLSPGK